MYEERNKATISRKISVFCRQCLSALFSAADARKLESYLLGLIARHDCPPRKSRGYDWRAIAEGSAVDYSLISDTKAAIRPALDAMIRVLATAEKMEPKPRERPPLASTKIPKRKRTSICQPLPAKPVATEPTSPVMQSRTDHDPQPALPKAAHSKSHLVEEFPQPLFEPSDDPEAFAAALAYHAERHGESYWRLHRAIVDAGHEMDAKAIKSWMAGTKVPRNAASMEILCRIERRYRLPDGYFQAKLPHQPRAPGDFELGGVCRSERRRLAWHLPDDFNSLPISKREEILEWVRKVIISGATDYRRFQSAAIKHRYAIRFPGVTYGRSAPLARFDQNDGQEEGMPDTDPDLLSGVIDAPPQLSMEMSGLVSFKTSTLTAFGLQRNGVWGEETTSQKIEHLGLMLGALAASPKSKVNGYGVPIQHLTLGLLVFPAVWDWYVQWRERRRGFYTAWEVDMLRIALALTREGTGWLRQHRNLAHRVRPIPGLVSAEEVERACLDWDATCDSLFKHATGRAKEIQRVAKVHRDPFEPIMPVLEAPSPVGEYRKITEEILRRMPDQHRYPRAAAETVRGFLMLRLGLHLGLRQKNLRQLMVCPRGGLPRSERQLTDMKRGELRWSERDDGWEVLIPSTAFKNAHSSYFGSKPFRLVLPDLGDLYLHIDAYIDRHRATLLAGANDPGTFFVKTVKATSKDPAYDQTTFYEAWRLTIQRYGIYNPYTGRGAIKGLLPHGPHNIRDVLATHILKQTGSYEQASYAIQDTPEMVASHYGRFLPQDKAALAAKILNQVWEAA